MRLHGKWHRIHDAQTGGTLIRNALDTREILASDSRYSYVGPAERRLPIGEGIPATAGADDE